VVEDDDRYIYLLQPIGWKWRSFRNAKWPSYWVGEGPQGLNQFSLRLLFDVIPMAWDLPVCVNMHEAAAFAIWKSNKHGKNYRVISELEHHAIRDASQQLKGEVEGGAVDMVLKGPPHGQMMREVMLVAMCFIVMYNMCIVYTEHRNKIHIST
jgi:hypothetical protein